VRRQHRSCYVDPAYTSEELCVISNITYGSAYNAYLGRNETLRMDVYMPPVPHPRTPRPAMVIIHGGSFTSGDSRSEATFAKMLAQRGFVAASINYRLTGRHWGTRTYCCPGNESDRYILDAKEDGQAALHFMRQMATQWHIDTTRIGIAGSSAGAVTVLHMGYNSSAQEESGVRVVVAISGELAYEAFCQGVDNVTGAPYGCVYGSWNNTDAIDGRRFRMQPPLCLVHGTADTVVPFRNARSISARALETGLHSELLAIAGGGHVPERQLFGWRAPRLMSFLVRAMDLRSVPCPAPRSRVQSDIYT